MKWRDLMAMDGKIDPDTDLYFMSDDGEEYPVNVAVPFATGEAVYFGEGTEDSLTDAMEEHLRGLADEYKGADEDDDDAPWEAPACSLERTETSMPSEWEEA